MLVGWVEFEISSPTPAKKSLNLFAMSVLFDKVIFPDFILSIFG